MIQNFIVIMKKSGNLGDAVMTVRALKG